MMDYGWLSTLKARAQELAGDRGHSLTWGERNDLTKDVTRTRIVEIYEKAYVELAESFQGQKDRINELEGQVRALEGSNQYQGQIISDMDARNQRLHLRLEGLLRMIAAIEDLQSDRDNREARRYEDTYSNLMSKPTRSFATRRGPW